MIGFRPLVLKQFQRFGLAALLLVAVFFSVHPAWAVEVIRSFKSDITVENNGTLNVRETILVQVDQVKIRKGIIRELPLKFVNDRGQAASMSYDIVSVVRNDRQEPFLVTRENNMLRIRIGRPETILDRMVHRYEITYTTSAAVGFFDTYDEIYWNVTGLKWDFPIERVEARISPPQGASFEDVRSYTGAQGATGSTAQMRTNLDGSISVRVTQTLNPGEGLTVAGMWPKGFVTPPPKAERMLNWLGGKGVLPVFAGFAGLLSYFLIVWRYAGRDPKPGPLVPRYYPPVGLGPAALRYVRNMGVDDKTLTSAILALAVKRYLNITEQGPNEYFLERTFRKQLRLTKAEKAVADALYFDGPARFELSRMNHARLARAKRDLETALKSEYEKAYFVHNTAFVVGGVVIGLLLLLWIALSTRDVVPSLFLSGWLGVWGVGTYEAIARTKTLWLMAVRRASIGELIKAIFSSGPAVIMAIGLFIGCAAFAATATIGHAAIAVLIVGTCAAFYHWMKAPTRLGRGLLDEIDGFKTYLAVAEQDRMDFHNPPDMTPDLFEAYLPHAMALDVAHEWSALFEEELAAATRVESGGVAPYRPTWYNSGGTRPFTAARFSNVLATQFASSISRSATPPTRSGGSAFSSGGGFSGGGGGGGGGSGW